MWAKSRRDSPSESIGETGQDSRSAPGGLPEAGQPERRARNVLYAGRVSLLAIRERMPFPLFVIVLVIVTVLAGFACACLSDHPEQALDRALLDLTSTPLSFFASVFVLGAMLSLAPALLLQAASRARLQTFRL